MRFEGRRVRAQMRTSKLMLRSTSRLAMSVPAPLASRRMPRSARRSRLRRAGANSHQAHSAFTHCKSRRGAQGERAMGSRDQERREKSRRDGLCVDGGSRRGAAQRAIVDELTRGVARRLVGGLHHRAVRGADGAKHCVVSVSRARVRGGGRSWRRPCHLGAPAACVGKRINPVQLIVGDGVLWSQGGEGCTASVPRVGRSASRQLDSSDAAHDVGHRGVLRPMNTLAVRYQRRRVHLRPAKKLGDATRRARRRRLVCYAAAAKDVCHRTALGIETQGLTARIRAACVA